MITINCDMGEGFGIYTFGNDAAILPYVTHANIACGFHASDPVVMEKTVALALEAGVEIGSHPGLPDREGFGRRPMRMSREDVRALTVYQTGALAGFLRAHSVQLSHIKPHGSLFGMAQNEPHVAEGIADAAEIFGLPVIGYANCAMSEVFTRRGVPFTAEFYVDLDYGDDGRQIISREHPPIPPEAVIEKVRRALDLGVTRALSGRDVAVVAQSICVHSDTPNALDVARAVFDELGRAGQLARA